MPTIYTIFNMGSAFDSKQYHEAVAKLYGHTNGLSMITEGVGNISKPPGGPDLEAFPNKMEAITSPEGMELTVNKTAFEYFGSVAAGLTVGFGTHENTTRVVAAVYDAKVKYGIDTVNLVGWSRGAIACLVQAWAIYRDPRLKDLKVNIVAFDPVPGPGDFQTKNYKMPPNVVSALLMFATDEPRYAFMAKPFGVESEVTKVKTLQFPGSHSDLVLSNKITQMLAMNSTIKFLRKVGTDINATLLTDREELMAYSALRAKALSTPETDKQVTRLGELWKSLTKGTILERDPKARQSFLYKSPSSSGNYFYNARHEKLFCKILPMQHKIFFSSAKPQIDTRAVIEAIKTGAVFAGVDAYTYHSLARLPIDFASIQRWLPADITKKLDALCAAPTPCPVYAHRSLFAAPPLRGSDAQSKANAK